MVLLRRLLKWAASNATWDGIWVLIRLFWPYIGTAVIAGLFLLWGWFRGNFGPELVALVVVTTVWTVVGILRLVDRKKEQTKVIQPEPQSQAKPSVEPKPDPTEAVRRNLDNFLRQGHDMRTELNRKTDLVISGTLQEHVHDWGSRIYHYIKGSLPGRASVFVDELPKLRNYAGALRPALRKEYIAYLDARLADLESFGKEWGLE